MTAPPSTRLDIVRRRPPGRGRLAAASPGATYRLQMHGGFTLRDAARITAYLHVAWHHPRLHVVASGRQAGQHARVRRDRPRPAEPGDRHGRGIRRHGSPTCASAGWAGSSTPSPTTCRVGGAERVVADVLEHGPASPYAGLLRHRLERPPAGAAARQGPAADPRRAVRPGDRGRPVPGRVRGRGPSPSMYDDRGCRSTRGRTASSSARPRSGPRRLGAEDPDVLELQSILNAVRHLPRADRDDPAQVAEGWTEKRGHQATAGRPRGRIPRSPGTCGEASTRLNGVAGDPASFDALDELLDAQAYRPGFWRVASDEINYRRFFDVNDLAALSIGARGGVRAPPRTVLRLLARGQARRPAHRPPRRPVRPEAVPRPACRSITSWRRARQLLIDADPTRSLDANWQLRTRPLARVGSAPAELAALRRRREDPRRRETLPPNWAVHGTTGYEFLNASTACSSTPDDGEAFSRALPGT